MIKMLAASLTGLAAIASAYAGPLEDAKERQRQLDEFDEMVAPSSSQNARAAAISAFLESEDAVFRDRALDIALDSGNPELIRLGLRGLLERRDAISFDLTPPERPTTAQKERLERYGRTYYINRLSLSESGEISGYLIRTGEFTHDGFKLVFTTGCALNIVSVSSESLSGTYDCGVDDSFLAIVPVE